MSAVVSTSSLRPNGAMKSSTEWIRRAGGSISLATALVVASSNVAPAAAALAEQTPSSEAIELVQRALESAQRDVGSDETIKLVSASIDLWKSYAPDELAGLLKLRSDGLAARGDSRGALRDLDEELKVLDRAPKADPAEKPRAFLAKARLESSGLEDYSAAARDALAALEDDDLLPEIERQNPFTFDLVGRCLSRLGRYEMAAREFSNAEGAFGDRGDAIRASVAAADAALSLCSGNDESCERASRHAFSVKSVPRSNNPDDIPLLQDLSRKDAELHLALAARLHQKDREDAVGTWATGSLRLTTFVDDARRRLVQDDSNDFSAGKVAESSSFAVRSLAAIASGLDPRNPYVTQRPGQEFLWYQLDDDDDKSSSSMDESRRRRTPVVGLAKVDGSLSSDLFGDSSWLAKNRPDWSSDLGQASETFFKSGKAPKARDVSEFQMFVVSDDDK